MLKKNGDIRKKKIDRLVFPIEKLMGKCILERGSGQLCQIWIQSHLHENRRLPLRNVKSVVLQGQWCFKDKGRPCLEKFQRYTLYQTLNHPPHHVAMVTKFLSPLGLLPPRQRDLSQIRKGIWPVPLPPYRRKVYVP